MTTTTTTTTARQRDVVTGRIGRAIILGAGPAGLATALGLCKVCDTVVLVEKQHSFSRQGSTFGLASNGRRALQELSPAAWERLVEVGVPLPWIGGGLMLPWWGMRDALLEQVRKVENIELRTGEDMVEIRDGGGNGVEMRFRSGWVVTGDFVVGADGVHSSVRDWLGCAPALSTGSRVFRGSLTVNDNSSEELRGLLDKGLVPRGANQFEGLYFIVFNFNAKHPGRLTWALSTTKQIDDTTTPSSLVRQVVTDAKELALMEEIFEASDAENLKPYPATKVVDFSNEVLEQLNGGWGGRGRVTLLGDAAHAMRPTDGQGGNQAFEDAVVLSRTLRNAFEEDSMSIEEALRQFETTRLPRVKRIHDDQRERYEKRMRGEPIGPMPKEFREWIEQGV